MNATDKRHLKCLNTSRDYEKMMDFKKWTQKLPFISFPEKWQIKIMPPFDNVIVRFIVRFESQEVSVLFAREDHYFESKEQPLWSVQGLVSDKIIEMNNTEELIQAIQASFDELKQDS